MKSSIVYSRLLIIRRHETELLLTSIRQHSLTLTLTRRLSPSTVYGTPRRRSRVVGVYKYTSASVGKQQMSFYETLACASAFSSNHRIGPASSLPNHGTAVRSGPPFVVVRPLTIATVDKTLTIALSGHGRQLIIKHSIILRCSVPVVTHCGPGQSRLALGPSLVDRWKEAPTTFDLPVLGSHGRKEETQVNAKKLEITNRLTVPDVNVPARTIRHMRPL